MEGEAKLWISLRQENDFSLDKSIEIFEEGVELVARSRQLLDDYTKRISSGDLDLEVDIDKTNIKEENFIKLNTDFDVKSILPEDELARETEKIFGNLKKKIENTGAVRHAKNKTYKNMKKETFIQYSPNYNYEIYQ